MKKRRMMDYSCVAMDGARQNAPHNHRKAEHDESGNVIFVERLLEGPWAMNSRAQPAASTFFSPTPDPGFEFFCLTVFVHVLILALQESFCLKRQSMIGEVGELIWLDFPSLWQE